ncbi:MAG: MFS transporter [Bacilli bacterium]
MRGSHPALLSSFLWMASLYGMFAYVGVYYTHNFHPNVAEIGLIIMVAGFGNMMGNILGGRVSDKVGKRRVLTAASVVAAVCVVSFSLLTHVLVAAIVAQVVWNVAPGSGTANTSMASVIRAIRGLSNRRMSFRAP